MKRKELLIWSGVIIAGGILGWFLMSSIGTKTPPLAAGPENLKGTGIGKKLSENYYYNIDKYKQVEPKLVKYRETGSIKSSLTKVYGLSVSRDGTLAVCGESGIEVYAGGKLREKIAVEGTVTCVSFGNNIIFGTKEDVGIYHEGKTAWLFGKNAKARKLPELKYVTAVLAADGRFYVADSVAKKVYIFYEEGKAVKTITGNPRFVIPSPHFDLAARDGFLYITNPGMLRIDKFTLDGEFVESLGTQGMGIGDFMGCCNPTNICVPGDGSIIVSEKGIPRVKRLSLKGQLLDVVAAPKDFDEKCVFMSLASDSNGRIFVLDSVKKAVRIFEKKK